MSLKSFATQFVELCNPRKNFNVMGTMYSAIALLAFSICLALFLTADPGTPDQEMKTRG